VARIIYSARALDDIERLFLFLNEHDPAAAASSAAAIRSAVDMLAAHPYAGRRASGDLRELVISFGKTGYVALYRFLAARAKIRILAIRHQRELDYPL
jgi:plasmid stabilization system protein ParE